jgi:hypothetical protein
MTIWQAATQSSCSSLAAKVRASKLLLTATIFNFGRALYHRAVMKHPGRLVMLCERARILARSDRPGNDAALAT